MNYGARNLTGPGADPEQQIVVRLTAGMLPMLGVAPARGGFAVGEDRPGAEPVVILSDRLWQRRYGGLDVVGKAVFLDGVAHTVIGVMAPHFHFPYPEVKAWTALPIDPERYDRDTHQFLVVGRLAAGV